ncbi:hypothetical protein ACFY3N_22510 [Streptomyces sp. NPDC000348]|uniref:hypothetical protein n=1 Tax=Streptomyces sp. NPDC000348 TaxID=3364538 RepID=UPI0036884F38
MLEVEEREPPRHTTRPAGGSHPLRTLALRALTEAAEGRIAPAVHRFPLAGSAAHRAWNRGTTGKVVLEP